MIAMPHSNVRLRAGRDRYDPVSVHSEDQTVRALPDLFRKNGSVKLVRLCVLVIIHQFKKRPPVMPHIVAKISSGQAVVVFGPDVEKKHENE